MLPSPSSPHDQQLDIDSKLNYLPRSTVYLLLFLAALLVRALSWPISLIDADEYAFILAGREVLDGHLPYTTFFDDKPVGSSVLLGLVMTVFGQSLIVIRVFGAVCVFWASIGIYETMRVLSSRRIEALGAAILYIAFTTMDHGLATMTEIILAPFTCVAVTILAQYVVDPSRRHWAGLLIFAAGWAFGLAIWIKAVPCIPTLTLGGSALLFGLARSHVGFRTTIFHGALFSAGVVLPMAITAIIYFKVGSFADFAYSNYGFMQFYVQKPTVSIVVAKAISILLLMWPLTLGAAICLWFDARNLLATRPINLLNAASYLWLAAEALASMAPLRMWPHYFLMTMPPLSILAAQAMAHCASRVATPATASRVFIWFIAFSAFVPVLPIEWANVITVFGRSDPQRESAKVIETLMPADGRSLLVLSYEFMADYLFTNSPLPSRIALPIHLFGSQSNVANADTIVTLKAILARNPKVILMDKSVFSRTVTPEAEAIIDAKLACCYREAADLPDFRFIDPPTYQMVDVRLFQYIGNK